MRKNYKLIFDDVMIKQLKKAGKNQEVKHIISKMLDKIELLGSLAGKLIDSKLFLYETKNLRPPIRLYYKHIPKTNEIYIFEFEMKTSEKKQKNTIKKIKDKF